MSKTSAKQLTDHFISNVKHERQKYSKEICMDENNVKDDENGQIS